MSRWSREDIKAIAGRYDRLLRLSTYPVAVKLFQDVKELEEVKDERGRPVRRVRPALGERLTVCQFIAQARYLGVTLGAVAETISFCKPGAVAMGFTELPEDYPDNYVGAYFTTEEVARKTLAAMPRFEAGKYAAMLVSPLERAPVDPDVVLFYGNSAQIIRFVWAYLCDKGGRLDFSCCGLAVCADVIVPPIQTRKPAIALGCMGGRLLSWPSENEVVCGVSADILEDVLKGMEFNQRAGVMYPVPWPVINFEPQGFIRQVLTTGFFPPEKRHQKL